MEILEDEVFGRSYRCPHCFSEKTISFDKPNDDVDRVQDDA